MVIKSVRIMKTKLPHKLLVSTNTSYCSAVYLYFFECLRHIVCYTEKLFLHHFCVLDDRDIEVTKEIPGYVCYRSSWNISPFLPTQARNETKIHNGSICLELNDDDFCSDFTVKFSKNSCKNFSITKNITIGV